MSDIRKSKDSHEEPGESDRKRKRESDKQENQEKPGKKKNKGFEQFRRLQQHNAEIKGLSSQSKPEIASEQPKPQESLGDITNIVKPFSISDLKPKEVKETIEPNERQGNIVPRAAYHQHNPLSLDLMHELQYKRQEIPKPPSSDTQKDKGQN
jgi:hypothetical protein